MRRRGVRVRVAVLALSLLAVLAPTAQSSGADPGRTTEERLLRDLGPGTRVTRDRATGLVRSVRGGRRALASAARLGDPASPIAAAAAFLDRYSALVGVAAPGRDLRVTRVRRSDRTGSYVHLEQLIEGVPVIGGDLVVVVDRRMGVRAVRGETSHDRALVMHAAIRPVVAARLAVSAVSRATGRPAAGLSATWPERWIFDPRLLDAPGLPYARLVWRSRVRDASGSVDQFVAVDARTGAIALRFDQVRSGIPQDATQRICDQEGRRESALDRLPCTAAGVATAPFGTAEVHRAREATEATYDFYRNRFGFDFPAGIPGATTGRLVSTVRYCPRPAGGGCPYANAFWNGSQMVYGTGFATADDVVGHELTHGVTEQGANLYYYMQSGALNEALSDIFGELIDQTNDFAFDDDSASRRWKIGEDIASVGVIRDMEDPALYQQPDRMGSHLYDDDPTETDSGGVHTNSGVANRALVLMVDGGTLAGVTVPALDADRSVAIDQAAALWFLVDQALLTTASDYADLADALEIACDQLAGVAGGVRDGAGASSTPIDASGDCGPDGTVARVIEATQMRLDPPRAPVGRVRPCTDPAAAVATILFDPIDAAGTGWQLGGSASASWSVESAYGFRDPSDAATAPTWHLYGADGPAAGSVRLARSVATAIPGGSRPVFLWFRHAYGFDDGSEDLGANDNRYDGGVVEIKVGDGPWRDIRPLLIDHGYDGTLYAGDQNPLKGRRAFTAESNGYGASRAVLTGYPGLDLAGRSVKVAFRVATDSTYGGEGWFIDDVRIYRCADTGDDAPPAVSAPVITVRTGGVGAGGSVPARVTFVATDPSGVALTSLAHAVGGETPTSILPRASARRADVSLPSGAMAQHLIAGARDEQGNTSAGAGTTVHLRLIQESAFTLGGTWGRRTGSGYSGGAVRAASGSGHTASVTVAGARSLGFVTTVGPDRGLARVCVDGADCRVLDLYRATRAARRVVAAWNFPGAATRTVTVAVLGRRNALSSASRVDLDGFVAVTE